MKGDKSFIIKKFKYESCEENLHLDSSFLKELAQNGQIEPCLMCSINNCS